MGAVPLLMGLVLFFLLTVKLELPPDTGYIRFNASTGFQLPAKLAKVGADSSDCRLYVLPFPLSAVKFPALVHQGVDLGLKYLP